MSTRTFHIVFLQSIRWSGIGISRALNAVIFFRPLGGAGLPMIGKLPDQSQVDHLRCPGGRGSGPGWKEVRGCPGWPVDTPYGVTLKQAVSS